MERNISPSVAAFIGLLVAMLLVGLYVADLDLDTTGVTAEEEKLPLTASDPAVPIAVRYPARWEYVVFDDVLAVRTSGNQLTQIASTAPGLEFSPIDDDDATRISIIPSGATVEEVATTLGNLSGEVVNDLDDYVSPAGAEGKSVTVVDSTPIGLPRILVKYVVIPAEQEGSYVGRLRADENVLSNYATTFDLMLDSVEPFEIEPFELAASHTQPGLGTIGYPEGWVPVVEQSSSTQVLFQGSGQEAARLTILSLEDLGAFLGLPTALPTESTPMEIVGAFAANEQPGIGVVTSPQSFAVGDDEGASIVIELEQQSGAVIYLGFGITKLVDDNWAVLLMQTPSSGRVAQMEQTIVAMVQSFNYEPTETEVPADDEGPPADDGDQETEAPTEEVETPADEPESEAESTPTEE